MEWTGPAITTFGAAMAAMFAWLTARDKYRFDAEKVEMRKDIAYLKASEAACITREGLLASRVDELERLENSRRVDDKGSKEHPAIIVDRRVYDDPNYTGPERRRGDVY